MLVRSWTNPRISPRQAERLERAVEITLERMRGKIFIGPVWTDLGSIIFLSWTVFEPPDYTSTHLELDSYTP